MRLIYCLILLFVPVCGQAQDIVVIQRVPVARPARLVFEERPGAFRKALFGRWKVTLVQTVAVPPTPCPTCK